MLEHYNLMDILFSIFVTLAISEAMKKHGTWEELNDLGDYIAWFMVGFFLLAFVRLPIYLICYGWHFPFKPSDTAQILSGFAAIGFWFSMVYWRIPGRVLDLILRK